LRAADSQVRRNEWMQVLRILDIVTPPEDEPHLIVEGDPSKIHPEILNWLVEHPRFHLHVLRRRRV
jgi:hypothetical protein